MSTKDTFLSAYLPAIDRLPSKMDSPEATVIMYAIAMQESRMIYRRQLGNGPARGLWQFELGTRQSRGGVWGVFLHTASSTLLAEMCNLCAVRFEPEAIWKALETDDVLAACVARLLLYTDPKPLPAVTDEAGAWELYANRCWRPGKPHPQTWPLFHAEARELFGGRA